MEDILQNLAALDLLRFCKDNSIPANGYEGEGTHTLKNRRGIRGKQFYSLVSSVTGQAIVTVTFYKNQVPTHYIHERGAKEAR